ncbi:MAG: HlyD family secretion protein, partial [Pseudomonadota bacterium]
MTDSDESNNSELKPERGSKDAHGTEKTGLAVPAKLLVVLIVASLAWYLTSDRFTPYTTQARVQGYVVGVA